MGPRDYEEKREFIRMRVECEVVYRDAKGAEHKGRAGNLSGRGVLFRTDQALAVGDVISLSIQPRGNLIAPLEARAEVVRVETVDPDRLYEIGVLFLEVF